MSWLGQLFSRRRRYDELSDQSASTSTKRLLT